MRYDLPIREVKQDRLDRYPAAKRLAAEAYQSLSQPPSVAMSLIAPWGWGKTSFLSLLEKSTAELPQDGDLPRPVGIWFNPWWFSGREDLYSKFFLEVAAQARQKIKSTEQKRVWASVLGQFSNVVTAGITAPLVGELREEHDRQLEVATSLSTLREKAHDELASATRQLWIFIDDLDRLWPEETLHFLTLVRTMVDLPWIRYFIAYDEASMRRALARGLAIDGDPRSSDLAGATEVDDYLDKLIQVEVSLPRITEFHKRTVRELLTDSELLVPERFAPATLTDALTQFAVEEYKRGFASAVDPIAWLRTYLEAARRGSIETPRRFLREFNRRRLVDLFDIGALVADIAAVRADALGAGILSSFFGIADQSLARSVYRSLREAGVTAPVAEEQARTLLSAMTQRVGLPTVEPAELKLKEDKHSAGLVEEIEKHE